MTKLLIQESPLTFQPSLAVAIGLNEAIVLQQVHYWLANSKNKGYEQDGYKWVYNTYAEWKETNFPFWSENTIQRTFANLEEAGLVVSIQPMKSKYDRTKYYRIDYPKLEVFDDPNLVRSLNESENTAENTTPVLTEKEYQQANAQVDYMISQSRSPELVREKEAIDAFESAFGIERPWNWYPAKTSEEKTWKDFRAYIVEKYTADPQCFTKYVTWRNQKYSKGTMSNLAIKRSPQDFPDSWVMFLASDSMYGEPEKTRLL